ncbi:valyl-tRNA synthetase [Amycolatopsis arida]|uniref:Valine--tRNA ligase n=1 Tax=Amycolatopsis arida TaxID=587909 RepID=A0A1I5UPV3_9PSEU|nr:valine--tRNA ligase [Amycolatopsis arida]TDX90986.1 valyl-tRNA synthetase [Amycolatopsis arida]SFP97228.1 valyl-tRNA synthetase [Amycolatopsis arida]
MTDIGTQQQTELPGNWNPAEEEAELYRRWVAAGYFTADAASDKPPFTIVLPPPNVTGSLHMGHALDHTLMDALTRRRRMQGYEVLWLPGMDHAGIATQNVVERELAGQGVSRHDLGREGFVERVWEWKAEYGGKILDQMKRLGDGVDWSRERFTMDEGLSRAVQTMFKRLYDDGLIYRAERIINWCPRCHTALSDIEVEHSEDEGELISIRYGDGEKSVVVATTRAETMLGDTAVAVHPDDERYRHLVGTEVELPLTGRRVPVVADEHVDPEFGTGAVKVTPAHDPNDFEIGRRHDLPALTIMDERGVITAHGPFEGLDRFEARPAVVAALREQGRIVAEKRPYLHAVGHCSRCDTVVEPRLSLQWWVRVGPLAKAAGDAVRDGRTRIHPPELAKRYFDWVDNMHDWTISRQLWWGHRIPVWYGPNGETVCVGPDEQPPTGEGWHQDPDVLDTWFSSGLWPFSTMGWPEPTADLAKFYPTTVLVTGYDILFFWVARMMMFGLYAMDGRQPFDNVFLHGLIRDAQGKKMSKSRGNVIDPLDWMDTYGADATRFTLARGANPGGDMALAEEWAAGARNFGTKLWNATRFALLNGATVARPLPPADELTATDRWILGRLATVVPEVDQLFEEYQFAKVTNVLYHFVWDELCDWYLELAKVQLTIEDTARAEHTRAVLGHALDTVLRLLHPFLPFVTERLWTALTGGVSLVVAAWPEADRFAGYADEVAAERIADVQKLITEVRRFRADQGLKPGQRVVATLSGPGYDGIAGHEAAVRALARLTEPGDGFTESAALEVGLTAGAVNVRLDLSGAIDVAAERKRLRKDLAVAEKELKQAEAKLGNAAFLEKAPAEVVEKIRARRNTAEADIHRITARLDSLPSS